MDLLTGIPRRLRAASRTTMAVLAAALAGLVVAACLVIQGPDRPHFSHEVHVVVNGLDCTLCHRGAYVADEAGLPPPQLCSPCHGHEAPDPVDPDAPMVPRFFDQEGRFVTQSLASVSEEVLFSHRVHVREYGMSCEECHGDAGRSDTIPAESAVTKSECMDCHEERGKRNLCGDCHSVIDADWEPDSHRRSWIEGHGQVVRFGPETNANRCDLCHDETTSCKSCHAQSMPRDHTHFWRLRAHGFAASMDRTRCSTCHRSDTCARCHEDTPPLSHSASFGDPSNRHCSTCHFPLASNGCVTCHKGTPSHLMATPMPSWHVPSMNCRACHGMGVRLPHPDSGHVCTICHK